MGVKRKRRERRERDGGMGGEGKEWGFQRFEILTASMLCSANLHHCAKFRAGRYKDVPEIWPLIDFSRWRPSVIFDFYKFKILTAYTRRRPNMRHHSKFCADRSNRCGDMAVFRFFKMAAVRHLVFDIRQFGPSTKCILVVSVTV